jgi:hypothetical protein
MKSTLILEKILESYIEKYQQLLIIKSKESLIEDFSK